MELSFQELKRDAGAVQQALANARSARNMSSRQRSQKAKDDRNAAFHRRRRKQRELEELKAASRGRIRVHVEEKSRPRFGNRTPKKLYSRRVSGMLRGSLGFSDRRGSDGFTSIHFSSVARGFSSTKGRRWRSGEAERAALYIVREDGLEGGEFGWHSNVAADLNELAAFYRTSEEFEKSDRKNANVYIAEIIELPVELTAGQRRELVHQFCSFFYERGLPFTAAVHLPDSAGDQRNYHCHIVYSLRPTERVGPYEWSFAVSKETDINTPEGLRKRRSMIVAETNLALADAGNPKRYTALSNAERGLGPPTEKQGQRATAVARRIEAIETKLTLLQKMLEQRCALIEKRAMLADRLEQIRQVARARSELHVREMKPKISGPSLKKQRDQSNTDESARIAEPVPASLVSPPGNESHESLRRNIARRHKRQAERLADNRRRSQEKLKLADDPAAKRDRREAELLAIQGHLNSVMMNISARMEKAEARLKLNKIADQIAFDQNMLSGILMDRRHILRERLISMQAQIVEISTATADRLHRVGLVAVQREKLDKSRDQVEGSHPAGANPAVRLMQQPRRAVNAQPYGTTKEPQASSQRERENKVVARSADQQASNPSQQSANSSRQLPAQQQAPIIEHKRREAVRSSEEVAKPQEAPHRGGSTDDQKRSAVVLKMEMARDAARKRVVGTSSGLQEPASVSPQSKVISASPKSQKPAADNTAVQPAKTRKPLATALQRETSATGLREVAGQIAKGQRSVRSMKPTVVGPNMLEAEKDDAICLAEQAAHLAGKGKGR